MASRVKEAVDRAQEAAEREIEHLSDEEYVEACDELEGHFNICAEAKRAELKED